MTEPASPTATATVDQPAAGSRLREAAVAAIFAAVLLVPKILHIRRNEHSWLLFRIFLGLAGAVLVIVPLGIWNNWILSIMGLVMFLAAALLPAVQEEPSVDEKARELGALVVLNGGSVHARNLQAAGTRMFLNSETLQVLDAGFRPVLSIPVAQIRYVRAVPHEGRWYLQVDWAGESADFSYRGFFAEHLARVAESSLNSMRPRHLPFAGAADEPRSRAVGAS